MNCNKTKISTYCNRLYFILIFLLIISNPGIGLAQTDDQLPLAKIQDIQYKVSKSPVHQWIAYQAYLKLEDDPLKTEIGQCIPDDEDFYSGDEQGNPFNIPVDWDNNDNAPAWWNDALIEGTWEEDNGDWAYFYGLKFTPALFPMRSLGHFWEPDNGYDAGLYVINKLTKQSSALENAQQYFSNAVTQYNLGENYKAKAYYWLGRTAHLLADMSVPAHVQNDEHLTDGSNYEDFTASWEFHYKHISATSTYAAQPTPPFTSYPYYTPSWFNDDLTNLFYELANYTDQFDSDSKNGDSSTFGNGKYRLASRRIDHTKTFWYATLPNGATLQSPTDLFVVNCVWSYDACLVFTATGRNKIGNYDVLKYIYYTNGSHDYWVDINWNKVPWAVIGEIFQPELQARAIGYTAALYQLFWDKVNPVTPTFTITPSSKNVNSSAGNTTFTMNSSVGWSVTDNASWLTATKTSDSSIGVTYDANTLTSTRTAIITATGTGGLVATATVVQAAADPTSLTVTSPNGGEIWYKGDPKTIAWTGNAGSNINIRLYKNGSWWHTVTSSTADDGSYTWTIPSDFTTSSSYQVKVTSTANSSVTDYSDNYFTITDNPLSTISEYDNRLHQDLNIFAIFPNPFNSSTNIVYTIPRESSVIIEIYDICGKIIYTLIDKFHVQGWHSVTWNGTNQHSDQVPAGLYLIMITSGNEVKTTKLMLLK